MRSFILCLLFISVAFALVKDSIVKTEKSESLLSPDVRSNKFKLLCSPCKKFFNALKKDLPDISVVTEAVLEEIVNTECETLDFIPFLDKICDEILDKSLDKLFDLIVRQDKKIHPDHDCQAIRFC
ncbi:hypothetical protein M3Y98_00618300 [Aphelenchoides besseyi]|nr:hypothetical protein M3Y98_00618300 [Aphelenchoides besseyi]KAI6208353.1 hypothetical protein M3Y96_00106300 [Aphelenchoides besseyi]